MRILWMPDHNVVLREKIIEMGRKEEDIEREEGEEGRREVNLYCEHVDMGKGQANEAVF